MTAQLKTVIDRMYAGGSTGFHFHQTALLLDAGADHVFDAAISQYKAMTSYLKLVLFVFLIWKIKEV